MSFACTETKIIEIHDYTLMYDEKTKGLRDKTYSELIKEHGHGNIKCSCMNRGYQISSQFVKSHFETKKHKAWVEHTQKEYFTKIGHCCSPQDIINQLNKDLRHAKCNISNITEQNKILVQEKAKLEETNIDLLDQINRLKKILASHEDDSEVFMECNL